jgi:uncharacterized protein YndB with AHSA1/START domain
MTDAGQPIELTTHVAARPATVLRFFTDPERFAAWFGPGSTIDPVPGGKFRVVYPGGQAAAGEVVELDARRIVLTWGVEGDPDLPPGASTIEVTLTAADGGTRVRFVQTGLPDEGRRAGQAAGFTHALAVLAAQSAGAEVQPDAERLADQVTAAFNTDDGPPRLELLEACWAETGTFRDPQANVAGRAALDAHIANARRFAAGANLVRGAVVVSHRELLWPWRIEGADGAVWAAGTNHAAVDPDGRIAAMTGFWDVGGGR